MSDTEDGEKGIGEENIETIRRSGGEKNVKEVSEISKAQGKPAEVEVSESEVSGEKTK